MSDPPIGTHLNLTMPRSNANPRPSHVDFPRNRSPVFWRDVLGYTVYRLAYPAAFAAASRHTLLAFAAQIRGCCSSAARRWLSAIRAAREKRRTRWQCDCSSPLRWARFFSVSRVLNIRAKFPNHLLPGASFHFDLPYANHAEMFFYLLFSNDRYPCASCRHRRGFDRDIRVSRLAYGCVSCEMTQP